MLQESVRTLLNVLHHDCFRCSLHSLFHELDGILKVAAGARTTKYSLLGTCPQLCPSSPHRQQSH